MSIVAAIESKLRAAFSPVHLRVVDDSAAHAGHEGITGGESHIGIVVVSTAFAGKSRVERSRMVHAAIADEIRRIHAVTMLKTLTPAEYEALPRAV